ncbi:MAG: GSCFA domain-containing protein [Brevundimonas sp.]|uniref:GSCFA domain-containing protein n=1 Tax=Brevundimonas sp. TaxID=1871086 RepID=UPI0025C6B77B|nr:GSCFA domain-containing protein [Brevundimonas sp.]MBX3477079.1 GSCFA domain-containing protein [Brevundimonas sp.]
MPNPYQSQPDRAFWSRSVARPAPEDVDPVAAAGFRIGPHERVVTAGSCFAQHISRAIQARGFNYLVTEPGPQDRQYGVYPARFGNLYTARQFRQLFQRAFGLFQPHDTAWRRGEAWVDPFRPQVEPDGFPTAEALIADRDRHLAAVRDMFDQADVLVFTLGLTEGWVSTVDGAVFPLAPGVSGGPDDDGPYRPHNFTVAEIVDDLNALIADARLLRPDLKVLLTVSPVPLVATITDRHVLTATTYSKSVLRVAAEMVAAAHEGVGYFPSYEIITGPHNGWRYLEPDLRSVRPEGVAQVMSIFARHYLDPDALAAPAPLRPAVAPRPSADRAAEQAALADVICDEETLDR